MNERSCFDLKQLIQLSNASFEVFQIPDGMARPSGEFWAAAFCLYF